jgi:hypothetical protein
MEVAGTKSHIIVLNDHATTGDKIDDVKDSLYEELERVPNKLPKYHIKMLTPFNFIFYSLHVSSPTGHPQVRYSITYLKDYFNTTDPLHVCNLIIRMLFVVIGFSTCSPNICYRIKYKNKNFKISKIPRYQWCCEV